MKHLVILGLLSMISVAAIAVGRSNPAPGTAPLTASDYVYLHQTRGANSLQATSDRSRLQCVPD